MSGNGEDDICPTQEARRQLSPGAAFFVIEVLDGTLLDGLVDGTATVFTEKDGGYTSAQWKTSDGTAWLIRTEEEASSGAHVVNYHITFGDMAAELSCNANGVVTTPRGLLTDEDVAWLPRLQELQRLEKAERADMLQIAEAVDGRALHSRKKEPLYREKMRELSGIGVASWMGTISVEASRRVQNLLHYFPGEYREGVDVPARFPLCDKRGDLWGYEVWARHKVVAEERQDEVHNIEVAYDRLLRQAAREVDQARTDILMETAKRRPELVIDSGVMRYNDIAQLKATDNPRWDDTHVVIPMYGKEGFLDPNTSHVFSLPKMSIPEFEELLRRQF